MPEHQLSVDHDAPDHDRNYCMTCDNRGPRVSVVVDLVVLVLVRHHMTVGREVVECNHDGWLVRRDRGASAAIAQHHAEALAAAGLLADTEPEGTEGAWAPRCPLCGWQAIARPYTDATREVAKAEARADVVAREAECSERRGTTSAEGGA